LDEDKSVLVLKIGLSQMVGESGLMLKPVGAPYETLSFTFQ